LEEGLDLDNNKQVDLIMTSRSINEGEGKYSIFVFENLWYMQKVDDLLRIGPRGHTETVRDGETAADELGEVQGLTADLLHGAAGYGAELDHRRLLEARGGSRPRRLG
jgi:hypothetical protein